MQKQTALGSSQSLPAEKQDPKTVVLRHPVHARSNHADDNSSIPHACQTDHQEHSEAWLHPQLRYQGADDSRTEAV